MFARIYHGKKSTLIDKSSLLIIPEFLENTKLSALKSETSKFANSFEFNKEFKCGEANIEILKPNWLN